MNSILGYNHDFNKDFREQWAIVQLYHGESKLHFDLMKMSN